MTPLLADAIEQVQLLSDEAQNAVAARILEEVENQADDAKWDESFRNSKEKLELMANEGLRQHEAGETTETDFEDL